MLPRCVNTCILNNIRIFIYFFFSHNDSHENSVKLRSAKIQFLHFIIEFGVKYDRFRKINCWMCFSLPVQWVKILLLPVSRLQSLRKYTCLFYCKFLVRIIQFGLKICKWLFMCGDFIETIGFRLQWTRK